MTSLASLANAFAPHAALANSLLPYAVPGNDGSHDAAHLLRVWKNALRIQAAEGGDLRLLAAAVLLHDCVAVEKNAPNRHEASRLAAEKAFEILDEIGWRISDITAIVHAVLTHSFSANIAPETLEAKILQDADRLDTIGMIGAARCFYIAGRMGSGLYDPLDPLAQNRPLDDKAYAIDHFEVKLFRLTEGFRTDTGGALARQRQERLCAILGMMIEEI